ncbi:MAG: hypothetical protein ACREAK_09180 [Nitrosarchaeum sp.]
MIPEEEILNNLKDMGYILAIPRALHPSYYKLSDGTIIRALIHINYLLPDPKSPQGFAINSINSVSAFVPKEKRRPQAYVPYNLSELDSSIIEDDVEFEVLRENFSVYDLSNGLVLSVKTVVGQIKKSKFLTVDGEPVYSINTNPILKAKKG